MEQRHHRNLDRLVSALEAEFAVVSPGSRNAPVISALMRNAFHISTVTDERSAGFQALGMAKVMRQAVVLSCTSGTATLNYYPAIAEAFYARVPLLILTADRPAHLIDQWEGQSIRQSKVFASHCRLSLDLSLDKDEEVESAIEAIGRQLNEGIPGPIHINLPLDEPLYSNDHLDSDPSTRQFLHHNELLIMDLDDHLPVHDKEGRMLLVNGMENGQLLIAQCRDAESYESLLCLSDLTSNLASSIPQWDAMLYCAMRNHPEVLEELRPDILVTTGTYVVSKGLRQFLKAYPPTVHYHISIHKEIGAPFGTDPIWIDPYAPSIERDALRIDPGYIGNWNQHAAAFQKVWDTLSWEHYHEFSAVRSILATLPPEASLHLGNSMPVRYAAFMAEELGALEVFSNRGTSGIDGCVSTAVGHAMVRKEPVFAMVGDLSFQYDSNALDRADLPDNLKLIILNNEGGRIFEFIDGAGELPKRQAHQVAARKRDFESLCSHFGLEYFCARDQGSLQDGLDWLEKSGRAAVLEVQTNPEQNRLFYDRFKTLSYEQNLEDH